MAATPQILQMLSGANGNQAINPGQIKQLVTKLRSLSNPRDMLQQAMQQNNPVLTKTLDYVKQHGGDPKAAFEALAKEKGINPADLGL